MSNGHMVSPNEMFEAAKDTMLDGREPNSNADWAKIMNFVAYNVTREIAMSVCVLFAKMYGCPLENETIEAIVKFQQVSKIKSNAEMN